MSFWPQTLVDWSSLLQAIGLVGAAVWALYTFRKQLKLRAADILLQVEEEFRRVQPTLDRLDNLRTYQEIYQPTLHKSVTKGVESLADEEVEILYEIDRCLRFFYFCTTLNRYLGVDQGVLAKAYYYYLRTLADNEKRPDLHDYIRDTYPTLYGWAKVDCP